MPLSERHSLTRSVETAITCDDRAAGPEGDWRAQIRQAFRSPSALLDFLGLPAEPEPDVSFPMLVPMAFARRMQHGDRQDPLLRQVLPDADENRHLEGFRSDPVGDLSSRRSPGLLHKYAGRVLLISTGACAVNCRYCFRQEFPYAAERAPGRRWQQALDWLQAHPEVDEVILSGGDPLMLATDQLVELSTGLAALPQIRRLRLHTRMPVVLPARITAGLRQWIERLPWPVVVVIHANHAAEFDPEVDRALADLRASGAHVLNQAVLLAGVNDDAESLAALMERSFAAGALPYYLHLLDRVRGAQRFEVAPERALELAESLRRRLPGYLCPRLVREEAGMPYKTPLL